MSNQSNSENKKKKPQSISMGSEWNVVLAVAIEMRAGISETVQMIVEEWAQERDYQWALDRPTPEKGLTTAIKNFEMPEAS